MRFAPHPWEFSELIGKEGQWFAILPLLSSMPDAGMISSIIHPQRAFTNQKSVSVDSGYK